MNPSSSETPGINLPPPVGENPMTDDKPKTAPEAIKSAQETAPIQGQQAPLNVQAIAAPTPVIPALNDAASGVAPTTQLVVPDVKDDEDLIEKEWVNKAKQIVERNRDDPYKQSEELTVFKADYMKKRYDKTIKASK